MSEGKDPAIKLFGRTITLPDVLPEASGLKSGLDDSAGYSNAPLDEGIAQGRSSSPVSLAERSDLNRGGAEQDSAKDPQDGTGEGSAEEDEDKIVMSNESIEPQGKKEKLKASSVDDMDASAKAEEEQNESSESQNKTPKKPDKILPCPRCNSLDTKFCYYNNYNVNQPRHFCKNCHRYWTAGGTMRNVPVGAGRRKNKNSVSHYRLETIQNGHEDLPNGSHSTLKPNDISPASRLDTPLCESMASGLNIAEKTALEVTKNGFHAEGPIISINGEKHSVGLSITMKSSKDEVTDKRLSDNLVLDSPSIPQQMAWFPGAPWPYPWNTIQVPSPILPAGCGPVGFSMPFYSAAPFWGCSMPGDWNFPWLNSPTAFRNDTSGPNSSILGKHPRDDSMMELANSEKDEPVNGSEPVKCLWAPKTLRIVDPEEAAKSSIWATLGITKDKVDSGVGDGLLKAFQSKRDEKSNVLEASPLLQANPAALSRSLGFQESS